MIKHFSFNKRRLLYLYYTKLMLSLNCQNIKKNKSQNFSIGVNQYDYYRHNIKFRYSQLHVHIYVGQSHNIFLYREQPSSQQEILVKFEEKLLIFCFWHKRCLNLNHSIPIGLLFIISFCIFFFYSVRITRINGEITLAVITN